MTYTKKYISKFKYLIDQIKNEDIENLTRIFKSCKKKKISFYLWKWWECLNFFTYQRI